MLVKVLIENTTLDPALQAAHGLSLYVESGGQRLLVDAGPSGQTLENAAALSVDISSVSYLFLSHGHYDHTGGVTAFAKAAPGARIYVRSNAFGDFYHGDRYIGMDKAIAGLPGLPKIYGNTIITSDISLLTRFTGRVHFPVGNKGLTVRQADGTAVDDDFGHEMCVVVRENGRFALFSGCAHNGILNIMTKFREVYGLSPNAVFSGFHMKKDGAYTKEEVEVIEDTARRLNEAYPGTVFYTGHCTGEAAYALMKPILGDQLQRLSTGLSLRLFEEEERFRPGTLEDLEQI